MKPDSVGRRLKAIREGRGLTLKALAEKSGVPQSTLSFVENGTRPGRRLHLETAKKLCWALGVGIGELAGTIDDEEGVRIRPVTVA